MSKSNLRNNNGYVLLGAVFLTLFLAILLSSSFLRSSVELDSSDLRTASQKAFYAAEAGIEQALFETRRNPDWLPAAAGPVEVQVIDGGTTYSGGYYILEKGALVDIGVNEQAVWVKSTGSNAAIDGSGNIVDERVNKVILARFRVQNPASFLFSTMGDLNVVSGATVEDAILGRDVNFLIDQGLADSDPNKYIEVNDTVNFLRDVTGEESGYVNPDGTPVSTNLIESMTFAGVDVDKFKNQASLTGVIVSAGDTIDLGALSLAGVDIVFAEGDLTVSGNYDHSMIVVADGDIKIMGDVLPDGLADPIPQIGLLAKDNVIIPKSAPSDISIEAFVMADGGADDAAGQFIAEGDITKASERKGSLNFKGAIAVRGDSTDPAINLNIYQNRDYEFNDMLVNNRSIPYLPFIANIISGTWQEVFPPNDGLPNP
ncbi:MAG: hypothetical protein H6755_07495 [Candidatus Omnitrophica bacterium]|nr:hypothetical protein [Candidatus Omnitrophota bacterium]MCB9748236.1 hypothetical protein [Candidatus Omnitrophota bacterium]